MTFFFPDILSGGVNSFKKSDDPSCERALFISNKSHSDTKKGEGEDKRPFQAAGLRGNGSKAKEKTGRNHDRSLRRIMKRAKKGKWV